MDKDEVQEMINQSISIAIKKHELRVGWISGIIGTLFVFGIIHSIWLVKEMN
jgi:hypothetical protein